MADHRYYFLIPIKKPVCIPSLPVGVRHLMDRAVDQVRGFVRNPHVQVLGVQVEEHRLWDLATGESVSPAGFQRVGIHLLMNPGFLLSDSPPVQKLLESADRNGTTPCGLKSAQELYAVALRVKKRFLGISIRPARLWRCLVQLVRCVDGPAADASILEAAIPPSSAGIENSPAMSGVDGAWRRSGGFAPHYMNTAFREILLSAADKSKWSRGTVRALLCLRDASLVPWVFNSIVNEMEHRAGRVTCRSLPGEMHISLTGMCNIQCRFCGYVHRIARHRFVSSSHIGQLDFMRHLQAVRLHSGHGEPTLNPHMPEIIWHTVQRHPHLKMSFFTNALELNRPELMEALVGNVGWINISLNAASRESWRHQCGMDGFERVCANVQSLTAMKRERKSLLPLLFGSIVLNADNVRDRPGMPALCRKLGIDRLTAFAYFALGYHDQEKFGPDKTLEAVRGSYESLYAKTVASAEACGVSIELPPPSRGDAAAFGLQDRPFYDFANIETNDRPLGRFLPAHLFKRKPDAFCHFLWRYAAAGSTYNIGHSEAETHFLYPCIGPLSGVDFSRKTGFRFTGIKGFLALWNNDLFKLLRKAQHRRGICRVCDICRSQDTRNPSMFDTLESEVARFSEQAGLR